MMDQTYDIDGVWLFSNGSGGYSFQLELGLGYEMFVLASVEDGADSGWILLRTRNVLLDIDYEDNVVETHVSFSLAPFHVVADRELFLEFTEPSLEQTQLKNLKVNAKSDPYSLSLEIELERGLVLTLNGRSSWILTDGKGAVLSNTARFEADVFVMKHSDKQQLVIHEKPLRSRDNDKSEVTLSSDDPNILPKLLEQIDSWLQPPIVARDLELFEALLTKAIFQCDVTILRRIAELRAFVQEVVDVPPEAETQTGENLMYSDKLVEVDTSKLRALAAAELERRGEG